MLARCKKLQIQKKTQNFVFFIFLQRNAQLNVFMRFSWIACSGAVLKVRSGTPYQFGTTSRDCFQCTDGIICRYQGILCPSKPLAFSEFRAFRSEGKTCHKTAHTKIKCPQNLCPPEIDRKWRESMSTMSPGNAPPTRSRPGSRVVRFVFQIWDSKYTLPIFCRAALDKDSLRLYRYVSVVPDQGYFSEWERRDFVVNSPQIALISAEKKRRRAHCKVKYYLIKNQLEMTKSG